MRGYCLGYWNQELKTKQNKTKLLEVLLTCIKSAYGQKVEKHDVNIKNVHAAFGVV